MSSRKLRFCNKNKNHVVFDFQFPKDFAAKDVIKNSPFEVQFNKAEDMKWSCLTKILFDESVYQNLVIFCEENSFQIDPEVSNEIISKISRRKENIEIAKANDFDITVDGLKLPLRNYQKAGVHYLNNTKKAILGLEMRLGKGHPVGTKIITPGGLVNIEDLKCGDHLIGSDGHLIVLTGKYDRGTLDIYNVKFSDKTSVKVDAEHLWNVLTPNDKVYNRSGKVLSTMFMIKNGLKNGKNYKWQIPLIKNPVDFSKQELPIDPYLLGVLLGDGDITNGIRITPGYNNTIKEEVAKVLSKDIIIGTQYKKAGTFSLVAECNKNNSLIQKLKSLNLYGKKSFQKFIPSTYLINSVDVRINLLQGLLDTDGYQSKDGTLQFYTSSEQMCNELQFLIESLGGTARKNTKTNVYYKDRSGNRKLGRTAHRLTICLPNTINPFRAFASEYIKRTKYFPSRSIVQIEYLGQDRVYCLSVDSTDQLYLTEHCILTHNTITALASINYNSAFPCLVIVPANLKLNWKKEIQKSLDVHESDIVVLAGRKSNQEQNITSAKFVIINYDILKYREAELLTNKFQSCIIDEAHYLGSFDSGRTISATKLCKKIPYVFALSGTIIQNHTKELASILNVIGKLSDFGGKWKFFNDFCHVESNGFGQTVSNIKDPEKALKMLPKLHEKLTSLCYLRKTKHEVLGEIPLEDDVFINVNINDNKDYSKFLKSIIHKLNSSDKSNIFELKRLIGLAKIESAIDWIENFLNSEKGKLVVFAYHKDVQHSLANAFPNCATIFQEQSLEDRSKNQNRFQTDKSCRLIVCSTTIAGEGITLDIANDALFVEFMWNPAKMKQAGARIEMPGKTTPITRYYLKADGTIDDVLHQILMDKSANAEIILDNIVDKWLKTLESKTL